MCLVEITSVVIDTTLGAITGAAATAAWECLGHNEPGFHFVWAGGDWAAHVGVSPSNGCCED